ncbi:MAG: amidohydrolase family protein [Burkholderiales bacterium]|jgi:predicted TIM-barrel fold metal-dependent hydrolase
MSGPVGEDVTEGGVTDDGVARTAGWDAHVHVFDAAAPTVPGHYAPPHRPLAAIEAQAARLGVSRLVIVQPSVYGTDHAVMLRALADGGGRHRGVAVLDASVDDATLDTLHAAGVRAARFNRVSPVGHGGDPARDFAALAPRLAERGWHLQWYARAEELAAIAALHARRDGPVAVLDHLAGLRADLPADDPAWDALARLAGAGAWVKLSGWYRLGADAPWDALHDAIRRVAGHLGDRLVWGSDWPHTSYAPGTEPEYAATLRPVIDALGEAAARRIVDGAGRLYA